MVGTDDPEVKKIFNSHITRGNPLFKICFVLNQDPDQALMLTSMNKCDTINSIESLNLNGIQEIQSKYEAAQRLKTRFVIDDLGTR